MLIAQAVFLLEHEQIDKHTDIPKVTFLTVFVTV